MKRRPRASRREAEREAKQLTELRTKLAALEPGGSPARPIEITSPAEVEVRAASMPCPRCAGQTRVNEHVVESAGASRVRVAKVVCQRCGSPRAIYFRLGAGAVH